MEWLAGLAAVAILWFGIRFIVAKRKTVPPYVAPPIGRPDASTSQERPLPPKPRKPSKPVDEPPR